MSDAQSILVVFGVLYLSECILWISSDAVCFTGAGRWLRLAWKPVALGNTVRQVFVLSLWPGARSVVALPWKIIPGPHNVALWSPSRGWLTVDYPARSELAVLGGRVQLGSLTIDLHSHTQAVAMYRWLCRLSEADAAARELIVARMIQNACDPGRAQRVMQVTNRRLYTARQLAGLLLLWTFVAGPLIYTLKEGAADTMIRFGVVYLGLWWMCAAAGFRCHRRLLPKLRKERWSSLVLSLISPPHAIREPDRAMVHRGRDLHPLAFAMVTMQDDALTDVARSELAELRYPVFPATDQLPDPTNEDAESIVKAVQHQMAEELTGQLAAAGLSSDVLQEPDEQHPDAVCWCPRCFNQFTEWKAACDDCAGVTPIRFEDQATEGSATKSDQAQQTEGD